MKHQENNKKKGKRKIEVRNKEEGMTKLGRAL
jgi:hypothetical protein